MIERPTTVLLLCALLGALLPAGAHGLELYGVVGRDCRTTTGLIVGVTDDAVQLLGVDGEFAEAPRNEVNHILVYNTLDNPIATARMSARLSALVREVFLSDGEEPTFTGWPIRFLENVIVFYTLEGTTHIVEIDRIFKIRRPEQVPENVEIPNAKPAAFALGGNLPECPQQATGPGTPIQPTRMISDQIRLVKFLLVYQEGFSRLNRFQSRAAFYAKPYLYEQQTRLGLVILHPSYQEELPTPVPFYFQWSSGKAFDSQAFFTLGSRPVEWLPNVEPLFVLRSDLKAHFFSASFVGNVMALSQGNGFMIDNRFLFEDFFARRNAETPLVLSGFNQIALTSLDFGATSFAGGLYYPVFGIQANGLFREIFSSDPSLIARFIHTGTSHQFRALASRIEMGTGDPSDEQIQLVSAGEMRQPSILSMDSLGLLDDLEEFSFRANFYRFGIDFNISKDLLLGVDEVVLDGVYAETFSGERYQLQFQYLITAFRYRRNFGNQAGVAGYFNYFIRKSTSFGPGGQQSHEERNFSLAVAIEFYL